jgi:alpha-beta hydrolase superfamily lysophospholipase
MSTRLTSITYEQGYHMLTRDLQAELVLEDIAEWIADHETSKNHGSDMQSYCAAMSETD